MNRDKPNISRIIPESIDFLPKYIGVFSCFAAKSFSCSRVASGDG